MCETFFEVEERDLNIATAKLRRQSIIPCVIYAKGLKPSIPIQMSYRCVLDLFKLYKKGDPVTLKMGDTFEHCILSDFDYDHYTSSILHINFYRLASCQ